jgi:hypothetical protein
VLSFYLLFWICRYINASAEDRGLRAFIPCHTEHCRVFATPLHQAAVLPNQSATAATVDTDGYFSSEGDTGRRTPHIWDDLQDLRLIQPPAQDNTNLTVLAGHFDFYAPYRSLPHCHERDELERSSAAPGQWSTHILFDRDPADPNRLALPSLPAHPGCNVSCFTVGRHPVDRAISYYYQRFYQRLDSSSEVGVDGTSVPAAKRPTEQRLINELTPQELEHVALSTREGTDSHFFPDVKVFIDEGMSDAACAAVLGLKFTSGRFAHAMELPPEIPASLYAQARANVQRCVVGLQDRWAETLQVLDVWFPWIDYSVDPTRKKMSLYSGTETRNTLRPELHEVLVRLNPCDMMLYEEMQRLFALQMEVVNARYFL